MVFFKYRGTTIRLSSVKLCVLLSLAVAAVVAVLTLHEMVSFSGGGLSISQAHISRYEGLDLTAAVMEDSRIVVNSNINSNFMQERIGYPTLRLQNRSVPLEIRDLREIVRLKNKEGYIRNTERFGEDISEKTIVIIVQVHNRPDYFEHLLKSLSRSRGIEHALLIISHDFYSDEMNQLVETVDFCKVLQIFFPFSDQLYPNEFPGTDPNDCPRDIPKEKARAVRCNNAETPDMFGHYREAKYTMTKHHWWWKINQVFDALNATKSYMGPVLFLEEDYYVVPDFYHVLRLLYNSRKSACNNDCDLITLGNYATVSDYKQGGGDNLVELLDWRSHDHNMGLAFDRATWNKIKKCREVFCRGYDEYNWDWSMMRISVSCAPKKFTSLVLKGPRVFHTGECGLHHKKADCNTAATVEKYQGIIDRNTQNFFPTFLNIQQGTSREVLFKPNGGWGDPRDHALCFQLMIAR